MYFSKDVDNDISFPDPRDGHQKINPVKSRIRTRRVH